jgi:hypothetical protein
MFHVEFAVFVRFVVEMASQLNHFSIHDIISVLHNLPVNVAEEVMVKLRSIGVELCGDLQFVTEQDLIPTVNPIMARRLVNAWTEKRKLICQTVLEKARVFFMSFRT